MTEHSHLARTETKLKAVEAQISSGLSNGLYKWNIGTDNVVDGRSITLERVDNSSFSFSGAAESLAAALGFGGEAIKKNETLNIGDCVVFYRGDMTNPKITKAKIVSFGFTSAKVPPGNIIVDLYKKESKIFSGRSEIAIYEVPTVFKQACPCDCADVIIRSAPSLQRYAVSTTKPLVAASKKRRARESRDDDEDLGGGDSVSPASISGGAKSTKAAPRSFARWNAAMRKYYRGHVPVPGPRRDSKEYAAIRRLYASSPKRSPARK